MANWTPSLDPQAPAIVIAGTSYPVGPNPRVETPNAVAYVTWGSDDGRVEPGVRVPYALESDLLNYLANDAARRSALDDRIAGLAQVVSNATITSGPIRMPDISAQQTLQAATQDLLQTVSAALLQKGTNLTKEQVAAAATIDPAVNEKLAVLQAAQTSSAIDAVKG